MKLATLIACSLVTASGVASAASPAIKEKIHVQASPVLELKDGGSVSIAPDGHTYHVDNKGTRVRMKNGLVMEGKDGKKYLHSNDAIWQQISTKGTLAPNR